MRITKQQLTQIIEEEVASTLLRKENRRLLEARGSYSDETYNMDAAPLLEFASAYSRLGWAVIEQLQQLMDEGEDANLNSNAVQLIRERLGGMNLEIDEALDAWETANLGPPQD